jgi:hypothetical protein
VISAAGKGPWGEIVDFFSRVKSEEKAITAFGPGVCKSLPPVNATRSRRKNEKVKKKWESTGTTFYREPDLLLFTATLVGQIIVTPKGT